MANLFADGVEINIEDGHWRLYNTDGANSLSPFFDTLRGTGLMQYVPKFAEARGLPGTVLASDYIKAVVVGFDEQHKRWLLGLHLLVKDEEKPRFVELVRWPVGEDQEAATNSHQAGRILAEYIGAPLKLFGAKKTPLAQADGTKRPGVTGPLQPHHRVDIDPQRIKLKVDQIQLPIQLGGIWLGSTRTTVNLRVSKDADSGKPGTEAPAYNQCVIDKETQTVRLLPPTGVLGSFLGPQGRSIKFTDVLNVELRHTTLHESMMEKDEEGLDVDMTQISQVYALFLTTKDESILLAQLRHLSESAAARHRVKTGLSASGKGTYSAKDAEQEILYLRGQQQDQQRLDEMATFGESAGMVIAGALNRPLVKTDLGDEPK